MRAIYLTDRPSRSPLYAVVRAAGIRSIIVHDHSSGERGTPHGVRRLAKFVLARAPWIVADVVIAVSDYVARRQVQSGLTPPEWVVYMRAVLGWLRSARGSVAQRRRLGTLAPWPLGTLAP